MGENDSASFRYAVAHVYTILPNDIDNSLSVWEFQIPIKSAPDQWSIIVSSNRGNVSRYDDVSWQPSEMVSVFRISTIGLPIENRRISILWLVISLRIRLNGRTASIARRCLNPKYIMFSKQKRWDWIKPACGAIINPRRVVANSVQFGWY